MPHLLIEHSDNLPAPLDHGALLAECHRVLEGFGLFKREDIKSRVVARDRFRVGAGDPAHLFVHATLSIMTGRDLATRKQLGAALAGVLRQGLGRSWEERRCDVTVEVREMERETYAKVVSR
jgi:5-carboxymethyl-2-hydroxymuconate isomerase